MASCYLVGDDIWGSGCWRLFVQFGKEAYVVLHCASHLLCVGNFRCFLRCDVISHELHSFRCEVCVVAVFKIVINILDLRFVSEKRVLHVLRDLFLAERGGCEGVQVSELGVEDVWQEFLQIPGQDRREGEVLVL